MIRDRGRIKWTSMMLPEHVKLLRDWAKEDTYEKKRELDEQKLESMNEILSEAMEFQKSVTITYYRGRNYELVIGSIHYWDEHGQKLHIVDRFGEIHHISINTIADARLTDE
ncbi:YolD-like family protein [Bacillus sp. ISL-47]|uniref:YolD-like family protein n=1 Tax=Bacillus sp. ISL-47 TaxID=2819130 RepID=UPI001BEAF3CD|nr:YolD-like family protein [Bacillus sp. ISL-47]MBT2686991.1 YolD-like family protein [Bacillus sp. ISL-47]MBT2709383.1 YolD-like family protein [Pseudomonas sp. ISL-84]